jgi:hypothetical protein
MLPDMHLCRNAPISRGLSFARVRLAAVRALLDEIERLQRDGDRQAVDAVMRQLTEEMDVLSFLVPAFLVDLFADTLAVAPGRRTSVGAR